MNSKINDLKFIREILNDENRFKSILLTRNFDKYTYLRQMAFNDYNANKEKIKHYIEYVLSQLNDFESDTLHGNIMYYNDNYIILKNIVKKEDILLNRRYITIRELFNNIFEIKKL